MNKFNTNTKLYLHNRQYDILVKQLKPSNCVNIVSCDLLMDIEAPDSYKEQLSRMAQQNEQKKEEPRVDQNREVQDKLKEYARKHMPSFGSGSTGYRINGKKKVETMDDDFTVDLPRGVPNYEWEFGTLNFIRGSEPPSKKEEGNSEDAFKAFGGKGNKLKPKKR